MRERIEAGEATFLIKIKAHRGELMNEEAYTLAEVGEKRKRNPRSGQKEDRG